MASEAVKGEVVREHEAVAPRSDMSPSEWRQTTSAIQALGV